MHGVSPSYSVGPVLDLDESEILHQSVRVTTVGQEVLNSITSE